MWCSEKKEIWGKKLLYSLAEEVWKLFVPPAGWWEGEDAVAGVWKIMLRVQCVGTTVGTVCFMDFILCLLSGLMVRDSVWSQWWRTGKGSPTAVNPSLCYLRQFGDVIGVICTPKYYELLTLPTAVPLWANTYVISMCLPAVCDNGTTFSLCRSIMLPGPPLQCKLFQHHFWWVSPLLCHDTGGAGWRSTTRQVSSCCF